VPPGFSVIDDFFPEARDLRGGIDAHFASPEKHRADSHQV